MVENWLTQCSTVLYTSKLRFSHRFSIFADMIITWLEAKGLASAVNQQFKQPITSFLFPLEIDNKVLASMLRDIVCFVEYYKESNKWIYCRYTIVIENRKHFENIWSCTGFLWDAGFELEPSSQCDHILKWNVFHIQYDRQMFVPELSILFHISKGEEVYDGVDL